ncbi:unnamed protein product, partial [Dovyalis caffra]
EHDGTKSEVDKAYLIGAEKTKTSSKRDGPNEHEATRNFSKLFSSDEAAQTRTELIVEEK